VEIVEFLGNDGSPRFTEKRLQQLRRTVMSRSTGATVPRLEHHS
jgi:hypothetical protein